MQSRLQLLRATGGEATKADASGLEEETLERVVDCRGVVCDAELWLSCLPEQAPPNCEWLIKVGIVYLMAATWISVVS